MKRSSAFLARHPGAGGHSLVRARLLRQDPYRPADGRNLLHPRLRHDPDLAREDAGRLSPADGRSRHQRRLTLRPFCHVLVQFDSCNFFTLSRRRTDAFPPEAFTPELIAQEGQRVKELYIAGILRQVWRRGDTPGAAIMWEAASEAEVREAVDSLPDLQSRNAGDWSPFCRSNPMPDSGRSNSLNQLRPPSLIALTNPLFLIPRAPSPGRTL